MSGGNLRAKLFENPSTPNYIYMKIQKLEVLPKFFLQIPRVKCSVSVTGPDVAKRMDIALLFHDRGTRRRRVVSSTSRPYFTSGKDTVPIVQEAGWAPGPVWTAEKIRPAGIRSPDRPARSSVRIPTDLPGPKMPKINRPIFYGFTK